MSAVIDMDDPLAAEQPKRDSPPQSASTQSDAPAAEPKRRGRKSGDAQLKLDLKEIENKLGDLLELPAVPMAAAGDTWPAQHIERRARPLAKAIAEACKDNPQLREKLLQLLRVSDSANLLIAAVAYAAPVVLYYGLLPVPPLVKAQFQIPDRTEPGVRAPSVMEQMREHEAIQRQAERWEHEKAERLGSENAKAEDPAGATGAAYASGETQARTPPAI